MKYDKSLLTSLGKHYAPTDFVFFWGHTSHSPEVGKTCLSQWYPCHFEVGRVAYNSAEQFMMAEKARLFGDAAVWHDIMQATDPKVIKQLGRKVSHFDQHQWVAHCCQIVVRGNLAKFSQNKPLRDYLLGTEGRILVEASPYDTVWGIGLSQDAPEACVPQLWRGENLLGFSLMEVRDWL